MSLQEVGESLTKYYAVLQLPEQVSNLFLKELYFKLLNTYRIQHENNYGRGGATRKRMKSTDIND
jgi:hypothetical protein